MTTIRPIVIGNWKMHGTSAYLAEVAALADWLAGEGADAGADVMICPPATLLSRLADKVAGTRIGVGGQDCHAAAQGAHTGDISAAMLKDAGASAVILGHSERRADHGERDRDVRAKSAAAHGEGLTAIICIGETQGQRELGLTLKVLSRQLEGSLPQACTAQNTIVAYEPVWAIGTGLTPTTDDVAAAHAHIRGELNRLVGLPAGDMRILYGGSVKPANAGELMAVANVDGALVGGASLKFADFSGIVAAYKGARVISPAAGQFGG